MEENKKEITGIYNTTFNQKNATPIKTDIELIEDEIIETIAMYVKGWHDIKRDRGLGAEHIKLHLEPNSDGYISVEELLNLGKSIREYISIFQEPFIDDKGAKIYEWENQESVRFRCVIDEIKDIQKISDITPGDNCPVELYPDKSRDYATSIAGIIITFYSDRNLNTRMEFKNVKVAQYYKSIQHHQSSQERLRNSQPLHSSQFKVQKLSKVNKSTDKAIIPTRQRKR